MPTRRLDCNTPSGYTQPFMFSTMKYHFWNCLPSLGLCFLIFDGAPLAVRAQNLPARIDIVVVAGEGVTHDSVSE